MTSTRIALLRLLATALALAAFALPAGAAAGMIVADSNFRPDPNGFSFQNYGDEENYAGLNAAEMQRLFGPVVCAAGKGGDCVLSPTARTWMEAQNAGMAGGHCYGFATLAELIYKGQLPRFGYSALSAFGRGATFPYALDIKHNVRLQRSIARAWAFQSLPSVAAKAINGTPVQILEFLRGGALDSANPESWTVAIFQRGFKGGHAITPYAVEDMGSGIFEVHVYDNNWPGDASRRLTIDTNANTWSYYAAVNPGVAAAEYEGDAKTKTLALMPTRPGLGTQPCPFCVGRKGLGSKYNEVRLDGAADQHAHLLITDSRGRRTGYVGGRLVNKIPGARVLPRTSGGPRPLAGGGAQFRDSPEPVIQVPRDTRFKVAIDGRRLRVEDRETLTLVGPTYDATIENVVMAPGQIANVNLSPRGNSLTYRASRRTQTPAVSFGAEARRAAYRVTVAQLAAPPRSPITFVKEPKQRLMWIGDFSGESRRYRITIDRYTVKGKSEFSRAFSISGNQLAFLYYGPLARANGVAKIVVYRPGKEKLRVMPVAKSG